MRRGRRGLSLIEVLVAIGIVSLIATLVYGALDGMAKSRETIERTSERFQQGRSALARMSRELQSAFLSLHRPIINPGLQVGQTIFFGSDSGRQDRVDFTSFSHRRLGFGTHESDQNELSYFLSTDPETGNVDLARRESPIIDMEPKSGGVVQVMAYDVETFDVSYLDPVINDWVDRWDTSQPTGQYERLPRQVRIELILRRAGGGPPYRYVTKVPIAMQAPISFGIPR